MSQSDWTEKKIREVLEEKLKKYKDLVNTAQLIESGVISTKNQINNARRNGWGPAAFDESVAYKSFAKTDVIDWVVIECKTMRKGEGSLGAHLLAKYKQDEKEAKHATSKGKGSQNKEGLLRERKERNGSRKTSEASCCDSVQRSGRKEEKEEVDLHPWLAHQCARMFFSLPFWNLVDGMRAKIAIYGDDE